MSSNEGSAPTGSLVGSRCHLACDPIGQHEAGGLPPPGFGSPPYRRESLARPHRGPIECRSPDRPRGGPLVRFGILFRLRGAPHLEPIENFTTAALAIAIRHDDRPIMRALSAVTCTCESPTVRATFAALKDAVNASESVGAETQRALWPVGGLELGYLDLVLTLRDGLQRESEIWVEAKVDAWESGNQLERYAAHAATRPQPPAIITLGRTTLNPCVPSLKWSDVVEAIEAVPDPHYTWLTLREFLLEERIVRQPPQTPAPDPERCMDVLVDVNQRVRALWPEAGSDLAWPEHSLRKYLKTCLERDRTLDAPGGPLRYGLMRVGEGSQWCLVVSAGKNDRRVRLDAQQMLRDADAAGLPQDWLRHTDRLDALERRLSPGVTSHDEIVKWFDEGLRQLRDAKILDRYLEALAAKSRAGGSSDEAPVRPWKTHCHRNTRERLAGSSPDCLRKAAEAHDPREWALRAHAAPGRSWGLTYKRGNRIFCGLDPKPAAGHVCVSILDASESELAEAGIVHRRKGARPWVDVTD